MGFQRCARVFSSTACHTLKGTLGGKQLSQTGSWPQVLAAFDLPDQYVQPNGQQAQTIPSLQQYYSVLLGPFEEVYRKNNLMRAARNQTAQISAGQGRPGMSGTFPPVGTLPAITGQNGLGMMGQTGGGGSAQNADASFGGMNGVSFSGSQGSSMQQHHQIPNNMNAVQEVQDMARLNGIMPASGQPIELNEFALEQDADNRKRKLEDAEDGKRVKHKSSEYFLPYPLSREH